MAEAERSTPVSNLKDVEPIGKDLKNTLAVMSGWFAGSHVEMVEEVAAYDFPAFENLQAGTWEDRDRVRAKCEELGVQVGAIRGGGSIPKTGPVDPAYHDTFEKEIRAGIVNARALGSSVLVGLAGQYREGVDKREQMDALVAAGKRVAPLLEDAGVTLVWETLNDKVNHKGYSLVYSRDAADVVQRTGSPSVKFLFDIYHQQISEGDVIRNIRTYIDRIGHFHFGDNPGRHEPGTGELNYRNIFKAIYETGYRGLISAEFSKTESCSTEQVLRILADCDNW